MKIPQTLKIGGHIFKVVQSDIGKRKNQLGECDTTDNIITIDIEACQSQKESTLIHEIFHALNTTFDSGGNHALMDSLAEQFYQVLVDNKMLK